MFRLTLRGFVILLGICLWASPLGAQQDKGTISGIILDQSGAAIPTAKVTLQAVGTGFTLTTTTSSGGEYVFTPLPVGTYEVTAEAPGFKTQIQRNLLLQIQQKLDVNFTLQVGETSQRVDVTSTAPPLQTSDSSLGQVIETQKIVNLPLNGRNIYQLVTLSPGVSISPDGMPTISGQPSQQQGYLLDGVDNNNYQGTFQSGAAWNLQPSPDAVQEFKVQTNNYSAEFGRAGGGVINVVTRSGTNELHGSAYEFYRGNAMDARNFFALTKPRYVQNQFGGSLGGPLELPHLYDGHNRTFFFMDYEGFRSRKGRTFNATMPSLAWRQGDFRSLLTGTTFADPCTGAVYDTGQLFDPNTTRQVTCANGSTGFARDPIGFGGQANVIDPAKIVVPARNTMALLPVPNTGPFTFIWSPVQRNDFNQFDVKMDHHWGEHDQLSWRYAFRDVPRQSSVSIPGPAASGTIFLSRQQGGAFSDTHIFSPHTVNEFRYGYTRNTAHILLAETQLDPGSLGFGGVPYQRGILGGLPGLSFSDVDSLGNGGWSPTLTTARDQTFVDTLSLVRGKHTFKVGGSLDSFWFTQYLSPNPSGGYSFSGVYTSDLNSTNGAAAGSGFAQFLFGIPNFSNISNSILSDNGRKAAALYIQDDWKFSPKLTVNAGLRWEFGNTERERFDRVTGVDYKTGAFLIPISRKGKEPSLGPQFPVEYSNDKTLLRAANRNIGPRLGLAYQLRPKTVVRTAFGIFYHYPYTEGTLALPLNPPWGGAAYIQAPNTGVIDPVTGQPVVPVTSIVTGFPPNATATLASRSLLFLYDESPVKFFYPNSLNWNFAIQQEVWGGTVLELAYSGTKGTHILTGVDDNQPFPSANPNSDPQTRRPIPTLGTFGTVHTAGISSYNAFQVKAEKQYSNGMTFLAGYTWAHSIDLAPLCVLANNTGEISDCFRDARNRPADRGNSSYDVRHRFVLSWLYHVPIGQGRRFGAHWPTAVNGALGGWRLGGITQFQSGFHFTPGTAIDPAGSPSYSGFARPNLLADPTNFSYGQAKQAALGCPVGHQSLECFFNPAAFGYANPGQFGNAGRNVLDGPGIVGVDFALHKEFRLAEKKQLQFRAEFFNALNTPNFANPVLVFESGKFAHLLSTNGDPRDIQLGLKFVF